jgi:hypothetical protein
MFDLFGIADAVDRGEQRAARSLIISSRPECGEGLSVE